MERGVAMEAERERYVEGWSEGQRKQVIATEGGMEGGSARDKELLVETERGLEAEWDNS